MMTSKFMTYQEKRRLVGTASFQYLGVTITADLGPLLAGETYTELYLDSGLGSIEAYIEDQDEPAVEFEVEIAVSNG